jgi:hypothetical protein
VAFVIAADEAMIKHSVKRHFQSVDDVLVTDYFEKFIQDPIRVPQFGVHEVRVCMILLFVETSSDLCRSKTGHKSTEMLARYIRIGEMFMRNAPGLGILPPRT